MSMKRLALIAAVSSHTSHMTTTTPSTATLRNGIITTARRTQQTIPAATSSASTAAIAATLSETATITIVEETTDTNYLNSNVIGLGISNAVTAAGSDDNGTSGSSSSISSNIGNSRNGKEVGGETIYYYRGSGEDISSAGGYRNSIAAGGSSSFVEDANEGGLYQGHQAMRPGATLHGNVNVLLGGAMLSVVITVVCVVCYCCHRSIKKRSESIYRQQQRWLDNGTAASMDVYSVEQCYDSSRIYSDSPDLSVNAYPLPPSSNHAGPPPSYDSVLAMDEYIGRPLQPVKYYHSNSHQQHQPPWKGCTIARQSLSNTSTTETCINNYRKYQQHPHTTTIYPSDCSCLVVHHETDPTKPTTTTAAIDSINNNNLDITTATNTSATAQQQLADNDDGNNITKPSTIEFYNCQLCGKLQQVTQLTDSELEAIDAADIENGNQRIEICSCGRVIATTTPRRYLHCTEHYGNCENANETFEESSTTRLSSQHVSSPILAVSIPYQQFDSLNNEINDRDAVTEEIVDLEPSSNSNQPSQQPRQQLKQCQHLNRNQQQSDNLAVLDTFNENGIIRMDMSQIIDRTGLPTYEAAIKLESSGYV